LSLGVAFVFLIIWTFARDLVRQRDSQKKPMP